MRIAIPIDTESGNMAGQFSSAGTFALYEIDNDTRAVSYRGRESVAEPGCGQSAAFLHERQVEVVMVHEISDNGVNHLLEAGIVAIRDAPLLSPDALIAHLVSGTLQATPPDGAMHGGGGGGCDGGGGCGQCCGGHDHVHE